MSTLTSSIPVERIKSSRIGEVDFNNLEFGVHLADHMLVAEYANGEWKSPKVTPFGEIRDDHYLPAFERGMAEHLAEIDAIVADPSAPSFDNIAL